MYAFALLCVYLYMYVGVCMYACMYVYTIYVKGMLCYTLIRVSVCICMYAYMLVMPARDFWLCMHDDVYIYMCVCNINMQTYVTILQKYASISRKYT
jgi:hypothetical protein